MHQVRKFNADALSAVFDVFCGDALPEREGSPPPFKALWVLVESGKETPIHRHHEEEVFLVYQGSGVASGAGEVLEVSAGDVLYFPPFNNHTIRNTGEEDLVVFDVFWENMKNAQIEPLDESLPEGKKKRVLVLGAPPTANGDLHVGHLAGPYIGADIHARYRRMLGDDAHLVVGIDSSVSWVTDMARRLEVPPAVAADRFAAEIQETLKLASIEVSDFYKPSDLPGHREFIENVVKRLYAQGDLVAKETPALVCDPCDRYLFEVYVEGRCPHCGAGTCGNGCEDCNLPNDCADLIDPTCAICGNPPTRKMIKRLYFSVEKYRHQLEAFVEEANLRTQHRAFCRATLAKPLPDMVCSHITDWGIPVPIDGFPGQCISPWLEGGFGYITSSDRPGRRIFEDGGWKTFWKSDDAEVIQFFGSDNSWVQAIFLPSLYLAFDGDIRLPSAHVSNQFYELDHEKFSTSRGHVIWGRDLIETTSSDVVRFYLSYTAPEVGLTSFSLAEFEGCIRKELVAGWQGWLRDLGERLASQFDGLAPEPGEWNREHIQFLSDLRGLVAKTGRAYEASTFSPQLATRTLCELVRLAHGFGRAEGAWKQSAGTRSYQRTGMALELAAAKALCLSVSPLMPEFASRLWVDLGFQEPLSSQHWNEDLGFVPASQRVGPLDRTYFPSAGGGASLQKPKLAAVAGGVSS